MCVRVRVCVCLCVCVCVPVVGRFIVLATQNSTFTRDTVLYIAKGPIQTRTKCASGHFCSVLFSAIELLSPAIITRCGSSNREA